MLVTYGKAESAASSWTGSLASRVFGKRC